MGKEKTTPYSLKKLETILLHATGEMPMASAASELDGANPDSLQQVVLFKTELLKVTVPTSAQGPTPGPVQEARCKT